MTALLVFDENELSTAAEHLPDMIARLTSRLFDMATSEDEHADIRGVMEVCMGLSMARDMVDRLRASMARHDRETATLDMRNLHSEVSPDVFRYCYVTITDLLALPEDRMAELAGVPADAYHKVMVTARNVCMVGMGMREVEQNGLS